MINKKLINISIGLKGMKIIARRKMSFSYLDDGKKVWPQCSELQIFLNQRDIKRFKLWISDKVVDEKKRRESKNMFEEFVSEI